jgi:DNA-binding SARP family transcriptional activator
VAGGTLLRQALVADGLPQLAARLAATEVARLTALEQRIQADLAAGRHGELVAELGELAAAYPFREQFLAHQMVALYRCGRQAEALAGYHLLRERLADELGVDPSPGLNRLYVAMLRADAALDWPGAVPRALAAWALTRPNRS